MVKAVRIHANGGPEVMRWEEIVLPPPGAGEARVRHTAIGINYSDLNVRRGGFYLARPLLFPVILGNEAAGVVESVGEGVTDVATGDRVAYAGMSDVAPLEPWVKARCFSSSVCLRIMRRKVLTDSRKARSISAVVRFEAKMKR